MASGFGRLLEFFIGPPVPSYGPSVKDVLHVKNLLHIISSFPIELIDKIIDFAEYWPHSTTSTSSRIRIGHGSNENQYVLRSVPLGFTKVSGSDSQVRPAFGSSYESTKPHPCQDPRQDQRDISERVIGQVRSAFQARGEHPCRKIVFTIKSHDQGWGGDRTDHGTYHGSFTWFDAGLEKMCAFYEDNSKPSTLPQFYLADAAPEVCRGPDAASTTAIPIVCSLRTILPHTTSRENAATHETEYQFVHPLLPEEMTLQKNLTSVKSTTEHIVTWSFDDRIDPESLEANELQAKGRGPGTGSGELVRSLEVGDVITVWGKARFPGWVNVIEEISIDVYWAV